MRLQQKQISASSLDGTSPSIVYFGIPDECPRCHRGTNPREVSAVLIGIQGHLDSRLRIMFQCTWRDCSEPFLGYYNIHDRPEGKYHYLDAVAPISPSKATFPETVSSVSPEFVEIYNQAIEGENTGLNQICGIGLRKALEFLIKDFCVNQHPTETNEIKKMNLGPCITKYCDDSRLQSAASRAVWLGNDEAHYIRKWIDKDISDLKTLIRLAVNWIDNVLLTQQYDKEMDPTNPPHIS